MRRSPIVLFLCCLAATSCQREPAKPPQSAATAHPPRQLAGPSAATTPQSPATTAQLTRPAPKSPATADDYFYRGEASLFGGETDKAIADFNRALAIDSKHLGAYNYRGDAWCAKGEYDKAIADYTQALAISPNNAFVYGMRGCAWNDKGEFRKAIDDCAKALAINPDETLALNLLARIYASCPDAKYRDGKKAVENASKANQLHGGKNYSVLRTLAAAYAECGDFNKAREFQEKAIELAPGHIKAEYRSRLDLYKQGKPYREESKKK